MYNDKTVPSRTEVEKAFVRPLRMLLQLAALTQIPDLESEIEEQVQAAIRDVAHQVVLLLSQLDRMQFVDIVDKETLPRISFEKNRLVISISGSRDEVGVQP